MAVGAQRGDVLRLVITQGLRVAVLGVLIGLLISLASTRVLTGLLHETSATDPLTFVGVSLLLFGVALTACYIPARRAAKVDPMVALRCE